MLHMKKNTKAKVVTLAATAFALASVLGLVHQGAAASSNQGASAPQTTTAQPQQAVANAPAPAAAQPARSIPAPIVNTRTRAS